MDWIKWMGHAIGVSEGGEAQIAEPVAKLRYLYKVYTETRGEEKKEAALSKVVQLFIATFGSLHTGSVIEADRTEFGNDSKDGSDHQSSASERYITDNMPKLDLDKSFGRQARELSLVLSFMFVNQIRAVWPNNLPREQAIGAVAHLLDPPKLSEHNATASTPRTRVDAPSILQAFEILCTSEHCVVNMASAGAFSMMVRVLHLYRFYNSNKASKAATEQMISRILLSSCKFSTVVDDLSNSEGLKLIFDMCAMHARYVHPRLRIRLFKLIKLVLSQHLDEQLITYIRDQSCIIHQIDTLRHFEKYEGPDEMLAIWDSMTAVLKRSCKVSSTLMDEFLVGGGYTFLNKFLLYLETMHEPSQALRLLDLISGLVFLGFQPLQLPDEPPPHNESTMPAKESADTAGVACVRNIDALLTLQNYFIASKEDSLRERVLQIINNIFAKNKLNVWLIYTVDPIFLLRFVDELVDMHQHLQELVVGLIVYIATENHFVPFNELKGLFALFEIQISIELMRIILKATKKLLAYDPVRYKALFRDAELFNHIFGLLKKHRDYPASLVTTVLDCIKSLLRDSTDNVDLFRNLNGKEIVSSFITKENSDVRSSALRLVEILILDDKQQTYGEFATLVNLLDSIHQLPHGSGVGKDILRSVSSILVAEPSFKDIFRIVNGFTVLASTLVSMSGDFAGQDEHVMSRLSLLKSIFRTYTVALFRHKQNKQHFRDHQGYEGILTGVQKLNILESSHAMLVFRELLKMASESTVQAMGEQQKQLHRIKNPEVVLVILELLHDTTSTVQHDVFEKLFNTLHFSVKSQQILFSMGITNIVLSKFTKSIIDPTDSIHSHVLKFLSLMASYKLTMAEWQQFLGMFSQEHQNYTMLQSLLSMAQTGNTPTFVGFDRTRKRGYECVRVPSVMDGQKWPPASTMMLWVCIKRFRTDKPEETSDSLPSTQFSYASPTNPFEPTTDPVNPFDDQSTAPSNPFDAVPEQQSDSGNPFDLPTTASAMDAPRPWNAVYLFNLKSDDGDKSPSLNISGWACPDKLVLKIANNPLFEVDYTFEEGKWYHISIAQARQKWQSVAIKVYINGVIIQNISVNPYPPIQGNISLTFGTPREQAQTCGEIWRLSSFHILDGEVPPAMIFIISLLGPTYSGNFQAPLSQYQTYSVITPRNLSIAQLVENSSILDFATTTKYFPVAKKAMIYALTARDLINTVGRANVNLLIEGAHIYQPLTLVHAIQAAGSVGTLLLFVSHTKTAAELKLAVELTRELVSNNYMLSKAMEEELPTGEDADGPRFNGYQYLAHLLHMKRDFIDYDILEVILEWIGMGRLQNESTAMVDQREGISKESKDERKGRGSRINKETRERAASTSASKIGVLANSFVFRHILMELHLWSNSRDMLQTIFQRIASLISTENTHHKYNLYRLRELDTLATLFDVMNDVSMPDAIVPYVVELVSQLIALDVRTSDLQLLCDALFRTIVNVEARRAMLNFEAAVARAKKAVSSPASPRGSHASDSDQSIDNLNKLAISPSLSSSGSYTGPASRRGMTIRNHLLQVLLDLIAQNWADSKIRPFTEVLTVDWMMHFMNGYMHGSSMVLAVKLVFIMFQASLDFQSSFRSQNGMRTMQQVMVHYCTCVDIYYAAFALLVGCPMSKLKKSPKLEIQALIDIVQVSKQTVVCEEAMYLILTMLKSNIDLSGGLLAEEKRDGEDDAVRSTELNLYVYREEPTAAFHASILQFILYLFDACVNYQQLCANPQFLYRVVDLMFPQGTLAASIDDSFLMKDMAPYIEPIFALLSRTMDTALRSMNGGFNVLNDICEAAPISRDEKELMAYRNHALWTILDYLNVAINPDQLQENAQLTLNLAHFCAVLVDQVELLAFPAGKFKAFKFIMKFLRQHAVLSSQRRSKQVLREAHKAGNRITVYLFKESLSEAELLRILTKIINNQSVIISETNTDKDFFSFLCLAILPHLLHDNQQIARMCTQIFKLLLLAKEQFMRELLVNRVQGEVVDLKTNGFDLLLSDVNAFNFWMASSHPLITRIFKMALGKNATAFAFAEQQHIDTIAKQWKEKRRTTLNRYEKSVQAGIIQLSRAEMARQNATERLMAKCCTSLYLNVWQKSWYEEVLKEHWNHLYSSRYLYGETSLWHPLPASHLDKWRLDETEGPSRMRRKLQKNEEFYLHYPHLEPGNNLLPTSKDTREFLATRAFLPNHARIAAARALDTSLAPTLLVTDVKEVTAHTTESDSEAKESKDVESDDDGENESSGDSLATRPVRPLPKRGSWKLETLNESVDDVDPVQASMEEIDVEFQPMVLKEGDEDKHIDGVITRLLASSDSLSLSPDDLFLCARVNIVGVKKGIFLVANKHCYMIENCTIGSNRHVYMLPDKRPKRERRAMPFVPVVHRWSYAETKEVLGRKFLLQPLAMEFFSSSGATQFLIFSFHERDVVLRRLTTIINALKPSTELKKVPTPVGLDLPLLDERRRRASIDGGDQTWGSMAKAAAGRIKSYASGVDPLNESRLLTTWKKTATQLWVEGEISNFQYLMHLNTLAGRSFNDLSQYPVLPWILADYTSPELDLDDPQTYRDLSRPMGALSSARAVKFQERYDEWDEHDNEGVPKWHYGSHYSSAGIVALFLIRLEPFTQHYVRLQSGRFDVPDRIFCNIQASWESASGSAGDLNLSDVRELIPEFFYLPEFLVNKNRFNFGHKITGEEIDSVGLPPWAKNDPLRFIALHRKALESEYVSSHLHEWIDLIFGHKQQGRTAKESLNVFYYLTYEGTVDIRSIEDVERRKVMLSQINNYGQTPTQLFKKPHPRRRVTTPPLSPLVPHTWEPFIYAEASGAVGSMALLDNRIQILPPYKAIITRDPSKCIAWTRSTATIRLVSSSSYSMTYRIWENVVGWGELLALTLTEDSKYLITAGSNTVVSVFRLEREDGERLSRSRDSGGHTPDKNQKRENTMFALKHVGDLFGHRDAVTHVVASRLHSIIVSASVDKNVMVWDLLRLRHVRILTQQNRPITALKIQPLTGNIIVCTDREITLWSINGDMLASNGSLRPTEPITAVACAHGQELEPHNLIYATGHADGSLEFWGVAENQLCRLQRFGAPTAQSPVTALYMRPDDTALYSGNATGQVILWSSEEELETERSQRNKEISASLSGEMSSPLADPGSERRDVQRRGTTASLVDISPIRSRVARTTAAYLPSLPSFSASWRGTGN